MKPPPARPSLLSEEQKQLVYGLFINQTPEDVGVRAEMNWTSPLVRCWVKKKWGIEYSERGHASSFVCTEFKLHPPNLYSEKS